MRTGRFNEASTSSRERTVDGGSIPSRKSTASHAFGYWTDHASNSASMPDGGTPCRRLAMNPHPSGHFRSASVQRKILGWAGSRASWSIASRSVAQTGWPGIGIGSGYRQVGATSSGSFLRMRLFHRALLFEVLHALLTKSDGERC